MIKSASNINSISWLIIFLFLIFPVDALRCDTYQYMPGSDTTIKYQGNNFLNYGMDKITDTYSFSVNSNLTETTSIGDFRVIQSYRGIGQKQNNVSFRDDEIFNFEYTFPIKTKLKFLTRHNLLYTSDERADGNNVLSRFNSSIGAEYSPLDNIDLKLSGGYEYNKQLKLGSPGIILNADGFIRSLRVSNFIINSSLFAEHLILNHDRTNSDIDFFSGASGIYENNNQFDINLMYRLMKRDILSSYAQVTDSLPIETRFENRFSPDLRVLFNILPGLSADLRINISNLNIDKSYKTPNDLNPVSKVIRTFSELQFGFDLETSLKTEHFKQLTGISYFSRTEENKTRKKFQITDDDIKALQDQEFMRDNISLRTRLYSVSTWLPDKSDTISILVNIRKLMYDTPSENNFDDRDEISYNIGISYLHNFTNSFSAGLFGDVQLLHMVFLKSERSIMNNWNRIFRFGPEFIWRTNVFSMNPKLEVLANYTIYDFEDKTGNIRSYSFRQIGYKDTISITLNQDLYLQSKINLRYFERGILFWDKFSESPQNKNLEYFAKLMMVSNIWNNVYLGVGGRIYSLKQGNISGSDISLSNFSQFSWGPESFLSFKFNDGSNISLQGWYEFQYINGLFRNNIPNLFLFTNLVL